MLQVMYGFADASGSGFGSTFEARDGTRFRIGMWSGDESDETSSNWKEFTNVVKSLEEEGKHGPLTPQSLSLRS